MGSFSAASLPASSSIEPFSLSICTAVVQASIRCSPCYNWFTRKSKIWASFFHFEEGGYLIRFTEQVDFYLDPGGTIVTARPVPGVLDDTVNYLYQNLVQPLVGSLRRKFILHASTVVINGAAAIFLAPSGGGKSTLAAYFASQQHRVLSDDSVELNVDGDGCTIRPGFPSIRLWDDSLDALDLISRGMQSGGEYTSKFEVMLAARKDDTSDAMPVSKIFLLQAEASGVVETIPLIEKTALLELLRHSFSLPGRPRDQLSEHFQRANQVAAAVSASHLRFPHDYQCLAEVYSAVLNSMRGVDSLTDL